VLVPTEPRPGTALPRLVRAWLLCGVVDGAWAIVLTLAYQRSVLRMLQGIASTVFGEGMLERGLPGALLGLVMHFGVAFTWSAVFLGLATGVPALRRALGSPLGVAGVSALYGPAIWVVMSGAVIPALTGRALTLTRGWWIQLAGHAVFVGLPIVWSIGCGAPRTAAPPHG
jgi:hypothetical protein